MAENGKRIPLSEREKLGLRVSKYLLLALAVFLTGFTAILPAADVPDMVYENAVAMMLLSAPLAVAAAWGYLALSERRWRNCLIAFGLNLLTVILLCRAIDGLSVCYEYYLHGGG